MRSLYLVPTATSNDDLFVCYVVGPNGLLVLITCGDGFPDGGESLKRPHSPLSQLYLIGDSDQSSYLLPFVAFAFLANHFIISVPLLRLRRNFNDYILFTFQISRVYF